MLIGDESQNHVISWGAVVNQTCKS